MPMKKTCRVAIILTFILLLLTSSASSFEGYTPLTREEFDRWPWLPEYTVFNFFPSKGNNCTWYTHGRMMQLGYCKYALDSMRFNANTWAYNASRGATVSETAAPGTIAFWDSGVYYGSRLGHVGVVEAVREDGAILVSDSSSSSSAYNVKQISPGSSIWPTAFISVPLSREKSGLYFHGEHVRTTVNNLNFRLEGANQLPVALPRDTVVQIREHISNGIYASQPGSLSSYHYWWYAAIELEGEVKFGWLAETYLETTGLIDPSPPPLPETSAENEPPVESDPDYLPEQIQLPDIKYGDVIGNGIVDVRDVTLVMQHVLKVRELDYGQLVPADVNRDGVIDVLDVTLIMRYILGFTTSL
ncbi:MAG: CHAP domain-containing protein [Bacillota bacterium]|nr:CHAP domain-containing protein [Bacillota bacterium]MDW7729804.1 CHAP domain-containing protein [Bacillota bacterium]